ncbi:MAG: hypothetical protein WBO29_11045 [Albidovulum sp.]
MRLAIALALLPQIAVADEEDAKAAMFMLTAFECSTYAEMSGDRERQAALFERGIAAGRQFFAAIEAGTITEEEQRQHVPYMLPLLAAGPSVDFVLGRIFEYSMNSAYDDVVKENMAGLPLPMDQWTNDDELKKSRAQLLYQRSNCNLF